MSRLIVSAVVAAALAVGVVGCSGDDQPAASQAADENWNPKWLQADLEQLDAGGTKRIGRDLACVVHTSPPVRIKLFVVSERGARQARAVRATLQRPDRIDVEMAPRRQRLRTKVRIYRKLVREGMRIYRGLPHTARRSFMVHDPRLDYEPASECPPVRVGLRPPGKSEPALEEWAEGAVQRYGADRVALVRGEMSDDG